jgi:myo-inositol-1(or 4)-monophosphatase
VSQQGSHRNEAAGPSDVMLLEIEETALELARLAGAEIQGALGRTLAIRYKKSAEGAPAFRDPVSEVDHAVEAMIRARLAERFPEHGIIGEEFEEESRAHDFLWAIDPIDGTTNFINGFPLFAASIGILYKDARWWAHSGVRPATLCAPAPITPELAVGSVSRTSR